MGARWGKAGLSENHRYLIDYQPTKRVILSTLAGADFGVKDCLDRTPEVLGLEGAIGSSRASDGQIRLPDGGA